LLGTLPFRVGTVHKDLTLPPSLLPLKVKWMSQSELGDVKGVRWKCTLYVYLRVGGEDTSNPIRMYFRSLNSLCMHRNTVSQKHKMNE